MKLSKVHSALESHPNEAVTKCGLHGYQEHGAIGHEYSTADGSLFVIGEGAKITCGRCRKSIWGKALQPTI